MSDGMGLWRDLVSDNPVLRREAKWGRGRHVWESPLAIQLAICGAALVLVSFPRLYWWSVFADEPYVGRQTLIARINQVAPMWLRAVDLWATRVVVATGAFAVWLSAVAWARTDLRMLRFHLRTTSLTPHQIFVAKSLLWSGPFAITLALHVAHRVVDPLIRWHWAAQGSALELLDYHWGMLLLPPDPPAGAIPHEEAVRAVCREARHIVPVASQVIAWQLLAVTLVPWARLRFRSPTVIWCLAVGGAMVPLALLVTAQEFGAWLHGLHMTHSWWQPLGCAFTLGAAAWSWMKLACRLKTRPGLRA